MTDSSVVYAKLPKANWCQVACNFQGMNWAPRMSSEARGVNAMVRDQLTVSRGGDPVQQHSRSRPPGPLGAAHAQRCSAPARLRNRFSRWLGPVNWCCVCPCRKPSGPQALQSCSHARHALSGKVCIATFGGFLTFAQTRNIEPSGRWNWPMARADVEH